MSDPGEFEFEFGGDQPKATASTKQGGRLNRYAISADSGTEQKGDSFVVKSSDTEAFDDETPAAAPVEVSADLSFQQIGQAYKGQKKPKRSLVAEATVKQHSAPRAADGASAGGSASAGGASAAGGSAASSGGADDEFEFSMDGGGDGERASGEPDLLAAAAAARVEHDRAALDSIAFDFDGGGGGGAPKKQRASQPERQAESKPAQPEFQFAESTSKDLQGGSLAGKGKPGAFGDEFDEVFESATTEKPKRKMLAPSKKQQIKDPGAAPALEVKAEPQQQPAAAAPAGPGLQTSRLAGILPPTHALDQYLPGSGSGSASAGAASSAGGAGVGAGAAAAAGAGAGAGAAAASPAAGAGAGAASVAEAAGAQPAVESKGDSKAEVKVETKVEVKMENMDEWNQVTSLRDSQAAEVAAKADKKEFGIQAKGNDRETAITYDEALSYLRSQDVKDIEKKIVVHDFRELGFWRQTKYKMFGPPSLDNDVLTRDRNALFCIAGLPLDMNRVEHERILQHLWKAFTGDKFASPTYGGHWEVLGFQGNDPGTDLRGQGMFGLLQIMWFLREHRELALRIYKLSRDEHQHFPFAVASLNMTALAMQSLRSSKLHGSINRGKSVFNVVNQLYVALFYEFFVHWKAKHCTVTAFDSTKKMLTKRANEKPKDVIKFFLTNNKNQDGSKDDKMEFTVIP